LFDFKAFAEDYGIAVSSEHHHSTHGWVQVEYCPNCHSHSYRLGYNPKSHTFNCWKCGVITFWFALQELSGLSSSDLAKALKEYKTGDIDIDAVRHSKNVASIVYPNNLKNLKKSHKRYLNERNFNAEEIEFLYDIKSTGHDCEKQWQHRIVIPVKQKGKVVTLQGRAVGDKSPKYYNLPENKSVVDLKNTLYGFDYVSGNRVIVVEGVFDMWRLGFGTVATYGVQYTSAQIKMLLRFDRVYVLYDLDDSDAIERAKKLVGTINAHGKYGKVLQFDFDGDPAEFNQDQVNYVRRYLYEKKKKTDRKSKDQKSKITL
jgi:DNA primase